MSVIEKDSWWSWEGDGSKVQVDYIYCGEVFFYGDDGKYGELSVEAFLNAFTPLNELEEEVKAERCFHVHYSFKDFRGVGGVGSTTVKSAGMLNHEKFKDCVLKDSVNISIDMESVFILTWVEMLKEDCEEFLRGSGDE